MKITPEDMDDVRDVLRRSARTTRLPGEFAEVDEQRDIALALILVRIWDRGYKHGQDDAIDEQSFSEGECPYIGFAHTRHWCGYAGCRDS